MVEEVLVRQAKALAHRRGHSLERVMNFSSGTVASGHGYSKTIPKRCFGRGVGVHGPVPRARPGGCTPTRVRSARGLQRAEVDRTHRLCVEIHAPRPASVGDGLPTDAAVDKSGRLRGDGPRSLRVLLRLSEGRASEPTATIL